MPHLRGKLKREHVGDIDLLASDHHVLNQAFRDRLPVGKRELLQIVSQQLPKVLGMGNHLLPMHGLLLTGGEVLTFLLQAFYFGREFAPPGLSFTQRDYICLICLH